MKKETRPKFAIWGGFGGTDNRPKGSSAKSIQKDRCVNTRRSFCGAPDWIRTSGLPGRSRTLYPTELRTHIYENRPKTDFSYSIVSGQIVVRLLQNRGVRCRKMALLCGFSAAPGGVSELSESNALSSCATSAHQLVQKLYYHIFKALKRLFAKKDEKLFCMR